MRDREVTTMVFATVGTSLLSSSPRANPISSTATGVVTNRFLARPGTPDGLVLLVTVRVGTRFSCVSDIVRVKLFDASQHPPRKPANRLAPAEGTLNAFSFPLAPNRFKEFYHPQPGRSRMLPPGTRR
jgi:hypothetical protein